MKYRRPVLLQNLALQAGGLHIHRMRLHREAPEEKLEPHFHDHEQLFLVLRGRLRIATGGREYHGHPGAVFLMDADTTHSIEVAVGDDPPFVLVVDLRLGLEHERTLFQAQLGLVDFRASRALLDQLCGLEEPERSENRILVSSLLLGMLDAPLRTLGWIREARAKVGPSAARVTTKSVERFFEKQEENVGMSPNDIAAKLGYDLRQINRVLKRECQLTLGQVRARYRLRRSQQLIRVGKGIGVAGQAVGFTDPNYFSRWFRRQTGMTPRQWNESGKPPEALLGVAG